MGQRGAKATITAALSVAVLFAAGIAGAAVVKPGISYPGRWDPRVVDLVAFVERERGLTFKHPVRIDFLDDARFRKAVTHAQAPDEHERAQAKTSEATLRAVGLLGGNVDLQAVGDELAGDGIIGLYSFKEKRVLVRGDTLDDERRMTLVHELTHVLQDQRFDISGSAERKKTSGASAAFTAVIEADAVKVAAEWQEALPAAARDSLGAAQKKSAAAADFHDVPQVFIELMGFPYAFGPDFLQAVIDRDGADGRNRLFTQPPTTEENILLPDTYLHRQRPEHVRTPGLVAGERPVKDSEDDVGMLSLLVMLAERIDFGVAWPAVQGWAGDAVVIFDRAGSTCLRSDVVFDEPAQAERFRAAFASWAAGRPATATRYERGVRFESCDPGAAATAGRPQGHVSAIQGLALRRSLVEALEKQGAPARAAACTVDGTMARLTADRLAELDRILTQDPRSAAGLELQQAIAQVGPTCR